MTKKTELALAMQNNPKGYYTLYHSKGELKKEWIKAVSENKEKAISMLKKYN